MRVSNLYILVILVLMLASCQNPVSVVESTFPDGQKRQVGYYTISGVDSTLVKEAYFYKSGALFLEGDIKEQQRDGIWKSFREDGQLWSEADYAVGIEHGVSKTFHDNGQLYYKGGFQHGKRIGVWNFYNKDGSILKSIDYSKSVNN